MREQIRYIWQVFTLSLRQLLRRRFFVVALLPILIVTLFRLLPSREMTAPICVGVAMRDESGAAFCQLIDSYGGEGVTFLPTDVETLEKNVSLSRWDCGLIVESDFETRLQELDTDRLITLVIGEGSAAYPIVREAAASCLGKLVTPYIAGNYLAEQGMEPMGDLPSAHRMGIQLHVLNGGTLEISQVTDSLWSKLLLSALSAAAAVYALLITADLGRWLDSAVGRMECRLRGVTLCLFPRLAAMLCPAVLGIAAATISIRAAEMLPELAGLLLLLGSLSLLVCRHPALWKPLPLTISLICPAALLYALMPTRLPVWILFLGTALVVSLAVLIDFRKPQPIAEPICNK